jgi:hypothetical protein
MPDTLFGPEPDIIPREPAEDRAAPYRIALRELLEALGGPVNKPGWCERLSRAKAKAEMVLIAEH